MSFQYRETIDYLYGLKRLGIKPGLESVKGLLHALGNPEREIPVIHVAGTNGKGSTSAMIESVLDKAGYRAGLFTSPHLVKLNERIRVWGVDISDRDLFRIAGLVLGASKKLRAESGLEATFFEVVTAMALLYFREQKVDAVIMETGLGGRLDATNALTPLVSIITNVALDHSAYLGTSMREVAVEKAGIIKKGVPVVSGVLDPEAASVVEERARVVSGLSPKRLGSEFRYESTEAGTFDYFGSKTSLRGLKPGLLGAHQHRNAAVALAALGVLRDTYPAIDESAMREGLSSVCWPGRFEVISTAPTVILDCAHNPEGASALASAIKECFPRPAGLTLIAGISKDKDISGILAPLVPLARRVILTEASFERAAPLAMLRKAARAFKKECEEEATVERAINLALREIPAGELIVIFGSIFVVGEARDFFTKTRKAPERAGACLEVVRV